MATNTVTKRRSTDDGKPSPKRHLRADIQGLRMIAVVAVVLDHLVHWPSGGFVGVDVFFVISGFLITGILLREHEKTGRISIVAFYNRRIKRIMPAAVIVLAATVAASWLVFNKARFAQTGWDAIWALFFGANWRFAATGTDYFQASGPVSPLQHFWSLSVEEQFYFVWPFVMILSLALAARRQSSVRRRAITGVAMVVIIGISLAWAFVQSSSDPTVAYFSTFTRAWELGIGALIAIAAPWWSAIPAALRPVLGWIGLIGIVASYFVITDTLPFPAPWALLPVLATGLVIIAGTGGEQRFLFPLTNPVSTYIGNISYSLYLWHFPVIIIGAALVTDPLIYYPMTVLLMGALAVLSYHLVEVPIQRSPFLTRFPGSTPGSRKRRRHDAWREWRSSYAATYKWGGLAGLAGFAAIIVVVTLTVHTPTTRSVALPLSTTSTAGPAPTSTAGPAVSALQTELTAALNSTSWPELDPSLDSVIGGAQAPAEVTACGKVESLPLEDCTWGEGDKTVLLVGDSTSLAYTEAFRTLGGAAGWKIATRGMFGCPFVDLSIRNTDASIVDACGAHNTETIADIESLHPDYVVVTDTYEQRFEAGTDKAVSPEDWASGMSRFLERVAPQVGKVVLLAPPPSSVNIGDCYTPQSRPSDCVTKVTDQYTATTAAEQGVATAVGGVYVDSREMFCVTDFCPAFAGTTPMKLDLVHITVPYAQKIAPSLQEILAAAGVQ